MSGQQQVTDEGTRPGKSHNAASESKLNSTLLDRRSTERWKGRKKCKGQGMQGLEAFSRTGNKALTHFLCPQW